MANVFGNVPAARKLLIASGAVALAIAGSLIGPRDAAAPSAVASPSKKLEVGALPLAFAANRGQTHPSVVFESRGYGGTISLRPHDVVLTLPDVAKEDAKNAIEALHQARSVVVRMAFDNASDDVKLVPESDLAGRANFLIGNDSSRWLHDVEMHGGVRYVGLYRGIDLVYDGKEGRMKGTFHVAPGVDPDVIRWNYDGVESVNVASNGDLELGIVTADGQAKAGVLSEAAPVAWQTIEGKEVAVDVAYEVATDKSVSFRLGKYDATRELVIDPTLIYRTLLGGNGTDHAIDCKVDAQGNLYVVGRTHSRDSFPGQGWPLMNPIYQYGGEVADAYVTKFDPTGNTLVYSTYIGGGDPFNLFGTGGADWGLRISLNNAGEVAITGLTEANNYPTTPNAAQPFKAGGETDAFLSIIDASGSSLIYSSYYGGSSSDYGFGIRLDNSGGIYFAGFTASTDLPTTPNCFQGYNGGGFDAFLVYANLNTQTAYATYLGFEGNDQCLDLGVNDQGQVYLAGQTDSTFNVSSLFAPNFSVYQPTNNGSLDAFLAVITPAGNGLADLDYFTYLGGTMCDGAWGLAVDTAGAAYLAGLSGSNNFPLVNSFLSFQGQTDAFCTKITPAGNGAADLGYSIMFGGSDFDRSFDVCVDSAGLAYLTGIVTTPTSADCFILRLGTQGFIFGGESFGDPAAFDNGLAISLNENSDRLCVVGEDASLFPGLYSSMQHNFPVTPGAFQNFQGGGSADGMIAVYQLSSF